MSRNSVGRTVSCYDGKIRRKSAGSTGRRFESVRFISSPKTSGHRMMVSVAERKIQPLSKSVKGRNAADHCSPMVRVQPDKVIRSKLKGVE